MWKSVEIRRRMSSSFVCDNVLYALLARTVAGELTFAAPTLMTRQAVVHLTAAFE